MDPNGLPIEHLQAIDSRPEILEDRMLFGARPQSKPIQPPTAGSYEYDVQYSFRDFPDWARVIGYGSIIEQEQIKHKISSYERRDHIARIVKYENLGDDEYAMFLPRPAYGEIRLTSGDALKVYLDEDRDASKVWEARILDDIPGMPTSLLAAHLKRPWDKKTRQFDMSITFPVLTPQQLRDLSKCKPDVSLLQHEGVSVRVEVVYSDQVHKRNLKALKTINFAKPEELIGSLSKELRWLLPGTQFDNAKKHDVFADCRAQFPQVESVMQLNEQQKAAVLAAGNAPCGVQLIHGPPSTGKSYVLRQCAMPAMMNNDNVQILVLSQSNKNVNRLAAQMHEQLCDLQKAGKAPPWKFVVRAHSKNTTTAIWRQQALLQRERPASARPKPKEMPREDCETFAELDMARILLEAREKSLRAKYPMINDDRVEDVDISLGYRMLQAVGLAPSKFKLPRQLMESFGNDFVCSYKTWTFTTDNGFDRQDMKNMHLQANNVKQIVLSIAACVVTTTSNASALDIKIGCQQSTSIIFFDEFAKESETSFLPIAAAPFTKLKGIIAVGDPHQLTMRVVSTKKTNAFAEQLKIPLQLRLQTAGFPAVLLTEQHRMAAELCAIPNEIIYSGILTNAPSVEASQRPIHKKILEFNVSEFDKKFPIVYLDCSPKKNEIDTLARTKISNDNSRYNEFFLITAINLLVKLLNNFPDAKIAYATPYMAQLRLALSAHNRMVKDNVPNIQNLTMTTWDAAQGSEFDIGVIDILIDETAGFQNDRARLNVAFSRWKSALYVIGSKSAVKAEKSARNLHKFHTSLLRYRYPGTSVQTMPQCKYYGPGQVDMRTLEDLNAADGDEKAQEDNDATQTGAEKDGAGKTGEEVQQNDLALGPIAWNYDDTTDTSATAPSGGW